MKWTSIVVGAICAISGYGCAFGTRHVMLTYPSDLAATAATRTASGTTVAVRAFEDKRNERGRVGEVRNGFGMRTAEVKADNNVVDWVRSAVMAELKKAGYRPLPDPTARGEIVIDGTILRVYCTALASYEGEVRFRAVVQDQGNKILDDVYTGEGGVGMNWTASSKSYGRSLNEALTEAARKLVIDLNNARRPAPREH
jgi:Uncharacterized lipoprotein